MLLPVSWVTHGRVDGQELMRSVCNSMSRAVDSLCRNKSLGGARECGSYFLTRMNKHHTRTGMCLVNGYQLPSSMPRKFFAMIHLTHPVTVRIFGPAITVASTIVWNSFEDQ